MLPTLQPRLAPQGAETVRVMVVDDTPLYRQLLGELLAGPPGIEVVGTASDGRMALAQLPQCLPDLLTLDVEMPVMNGLDTLRHRRQVAPQVAAIMVSSHTGQGAATTVQALEYGAFDCVAKPRQPRAEGVSQLQQRLHRIIQAWRAHQRLGRMVQGMESPHKPLLAARLAASTAADRVLPRPQTIVKPSACEIVVIGVSTGGPQALARVIPQLPAALPVPVVIVQHMPAAFTVALARSLHEKSAIAVVEAQHRQELEAGTVYIAPGGKQLKLLQPAALSSPCLWLTDDPPENHCKPSVDYLFRSVAALYGPRALGIIMTGMGADGVSGLRLMKQAGATVLAQDQASCVVFGMPMEAIKAGVVDTVVTLEQLAPALLQHVSHR
ncbi:MAG: chemotaxis response regulator protein-glutamate methylesterase [Candidatus Tectimicrobiota bacterium]